jgi:hypothetical protein
MNDNASWHYGGDFPKGLPREAGATHIGMFAAWALLSGLGDTESVEELQQEIPLLRSRKITPGRFVMEFCDEKFSSDNYLTEEGSAFADDYYQLETEGGYLPDYADVLGEDVPTVYHIADTWENFDKLKPVLDRRYSEWTKSRK